MELEKLSMKSDDEEIRLSTRLKMSDQWIDREELIKLIEALEERVVMAEQSANPRTIHNASVAMNTCQSLQLKNQRLLKTLKDAVQQKNLSQCKRVLIQMSD